MPGYGSRSRSPPSALNPLFEPLHLHSLSGVPEAHIETAEIIYVLVGDPAALALDGYESLLGPQAILSSYTVQLFDGLARQRRPQRPAKLPLTALPELPVLHLHEPFPTHALYYRLFTQVRGRGILRTSPKRSSPKFSDR